MLLLLAGNSPSFGQLALDLGVSLLAATSIFNSLATVLMLAVSVGLAFYVGRFLVRLIRR